MKTTTDRKRKQEGPKTFGSYKGLGITMPESLDANSVCPICSDTASKRRLRNRCAFEIHRAWSR